MTREEFLDVLARLRCAPVGRARLRAPHKPLLLLWLFGRFTSTGSTTAAYSEAEEPVSTLINDFGPPDCEQHDELDHHLRAYLLVRRGHGAVGCWGRGIWTIHCAECEPMPDLAGGVSGRGLRADGAAGEISGMLRRAGENQAPVGSPLSVGEDDPDLARGEGHPLPGRGSEGGAAVGVRPGPVRGPGLTVAQDQGRA